MDEQKVQCLLFLREQGKAERKEGLGVHKFGRIPIVNEYISLYTESPVYKVTHVHHTGFGAHQAELYVVEAEDVQSISGDPILPP